MADLVLNGPARSTRERVASFPLDTHSFVGPQIAAAFVAALDAAGLPADDPHAAASLAALRAWDGDAAANSRGAAVYESLLFVMLRDMAQPVLGPAYGGYASAVLPQKQMYALTTLLAAPRAPFFGATGPDNARDRLDAAVSRALGEADTLLAAALGPDDTTWAWGGIHTLTYNHPLAAIAPPFAIGSFPANGDATTLNVGGLFRNLPLLALPQADLLARGGLRAVFAQDSLAVLRQVYDLGDPNATLGVNSVGQSGDPRSPHYADHAPHWRAGEYFTIPFTPDAVCAPNP
jgi:penicillin amidase